MSRTFTIMGSLCEKESGLPIPGLLVKAFDEDGLTDDLLGSAITGEDGSFEINYREEDFAEVGEGKPDIYLGIYQQPLRHLMDTQDRVRWGASPQERFDIEIPRQVLGSASPVRPTDRVEGGIRLSAKRLVIERRRDFDVPTLHGFRLGGPPGAPALPELVQYVALPSGAKVTRFDVSPGESIVLPGPVSPMPVQSPVFDVDTPPGRAHEVAALWMPRFTPLDEKYVGDGTPYPSNLAAIGCTRESSGIDFVEVRVWPVQYDPHRRTYVFYPKLRYTVTFTPRSGPSSNVVPEIDHHRAQILTHVLSSPVVKAASSLRPFASPPPPTSLRVVQARSIPQHVIITDDFKWPLDKILRAPGSANPTRPPILSERGAALDGPSMVEEFSRLAEWKTRRGVPSRVVTVSDIVSGSAGGDFLSDATTGKARDLQEVIRNFIKYAYREWHTAYVLLGGDINVVPIRRLSGYVPRDDWDCARSDQNPPPPRKCFIQDNGFAKLRLDLGGLFSGKPPLEITPLFVQRSGRQIPFRRGVFQGSYNWFFVDDKEFNDPNKTDHFKPLDYGERSKYVIVHGPQDIINDDYYWIPEDRLIASDLYYACVDDRYSYAGYHDFDANRNGHYVRHYGQFRYDQGRDVPLSLPSGKPTFDPDNPDVFVGRAPVSSGQHAKNFVDKVITYESRRAADGALAPLAYLRKRLYVADYHMRNSCEPAKWSGGPINGKEMTEGTFVEDQANGFAYMVRPPGLWDGVTFFEDQAQAKMAKWRLVACHKINADKVIPMAGSAEHVRAGGGRPKWYFTDEYYKNEREDATPYVCVEGTGQEVKPDSFLWDPVSVADNFQQKEDTRKLMDEVFPALPKSECERYYSDYHDLSYPPLIAPYKTKAVVAALNAGPHFVSMSAHGGWGGIAYLYCCDVKALVNRDQNFIAFVKSCLTAKADASQAGPCPADGQHDTCGSGDYHVACTDLGASAHGRLQGWRYCNKCRNLVFGDNSGVCCAGGQHDTTNSYNYVLLYRVRPSGGQSNWRLCRKCRSLVFGGAAGQCPAGGYHDIVRSLDYSLLYTAHSTRQPDWRWCRKCQGLHYCPNCTPQSFGEKLVTQRHGAVAYVGFTAMAPFETNAYEDSFWTLVASFGRLGPAAGLHGAVANADKSMWSSFAQILYGDPEMPVWTSLPRSYSVSHPSVVAFRHRLRVTVSDTSGRPVKEQCVTLIAGWSNSGAQMERSRVTNTQGKTTFLLPSAGSFSEATLTVSDSVAPPRFKPYVAKIKIH